MNQLRSIELENGKYKISLRGKSFHIDAGAGVSAIDLINFNPIEALFNYVCELEDRRDKTSGKALPADAQVEFDTEYGRHLVLEDGKYEIGIDQDRHFTALRYGEPWRDLTGDKLVLALFDRVCDQEDCDADRRQLVRELDVLINGEDGAAKQASLCDVVSQVQSLVNKNDDQYTEGVCADGAAILRNGRMLTISEVLGLLNGRANLGVAP